MAMAARQIVIVLAVALAVAGCATPLTTREKGALTGGAIGAGAGAAIGSTTGHAGTGALIGAGVGAVSGALIGDAMQANEQRQAAPAPPAAAPPAAPQVAIVAPPPVVVPSPQLIWVPQWGVYVLEGHDIVYHGSQYYYLYGGRWYVSRAYTGPWAIVSAPPPMLAKLPPGQFHRQLPPGLQKNGKIPPGHMR
ncbi:MAG: glycine zipper 2TM domain-containing protein [candidate division NC10 bacterium]|nr:glycine zipper 2TM domain-containing protein [candidate division NC10 bacterium]